MVWQWERREVTSQVMAKVKSTFSAVTWKPCIGRGKINQICHRFKNQVESVCHTNRPTTFPHFIPNSDVSELKMDTNKTFRSSKLETWGFSSNAGPIQVCRGALYGCLVLFQVQSCETRFFKWIWTRSNSVWLRAEEFAAVEKWENTIFIRIKGFVLPLSQLKHMVFNFSSFPCSSISRINDAFSESSP